MVKVSRRDFLKISAGAGVAASFMNKDILEKALALIFQNQTDINLVWLNGQACTGCTISAIQWCGNVGATYTTNLFQILLGGVLPGGVTADLEFIETLMPQAGCYYSDDGEEYVAYQAPFTAGPGVGKEDQSYVDAMEWLKSVLKSNQINVVIVEGAIPYEKWGDNEEMGFCEMGMEEIGGKYYEGKMWMFGDIIKFAHEQNSVIFFIAMGECASFGGIPGGNPNPTGAKGLMHFLEDAATSEQFGWITKPPYPSPILPAPSGLHKLVINLPGCPPNPDNLVLVIAAYLAGGASYIQFDRWCRPTKVTLDGTNWIELYNRQVHDWCERKRAFDNGDFAYTFEEAIDNPEKCLLKLGCRGVDSFNDCSYKGIFVGGPWSSGRWNPNGIGFWNKDRDNPVGGGGMANVIDAGGEVNPGSWCVAAGSPCYGCSTTTFPDNVLGRSFFIECTHAEMLDDCRLPGLCSSAPEMQGLTCYTCHSVTMPRKYKKWITPEYGYGYSYGPYYP